MKWFKLIMGCLFAGSCSGNAQPMLTSSKKPKMQQKNYISTQNEENLIPFHDDAGKWGYWDARAGSVAIPSKYVQAGLFHNGMARVSNENSNKTRWDDPDWTGLINTKGQELLPPLFTNVSDVEITGNRVVAKDLIYLKNVTKNDGTSGVIDLKTGQWVVKSLHGQRIIFYDRHHFITDKIAFYFNDKRLTLPDKLQIDRVMFSPDFIKVENNFGAKGLYSWEGKEIIPPKYLDLDIDSATQRIVASGLKGGTTLGNLKQLMRSKNDGGKNIKVDLYDFEGNKVAGYQSQYQAMITDDHIGSFEVANQTTYFNLKDGKIIPVKRSVVDTIAQQYLLFEENELVGLKTFSGKMILPPTYRSIQYIDSDFIIAQTPEIKYKVFNDKGEPALNATYDGLAYLPVLHRFMASVGNNSGQIGWQGQVIIPIEYSGFSSLSLMLAPPYAVYKDYKYGIIDGNGGTIVPFIYDDITDSRILEKTKLPYFILEKDEHYGMMDSGGHWLIPPNYGYISISKHNFDGQWVHLEAYPRNKNLYGLYNPKTAVVIPPEYNLVSAHKDFIIAAKRKDNEYYYQLLSVSGKPLTDSLYTKMEYTNGYLLCVRNKQYGILNAKGSTLIPCDYQYIWPKTNRLIMVQQGDDYFYMTIDGVSYQHPQRKN